MPYLFFVSLVWAASFGLIKRYLILVDPDLVNAVRLVLTFLVFAPFLRVRGVGTARLLELAAIGAVQFGAMYALYTRSYGVLKAHEVALATVMTPLYVTLLDDLLERRLRPVFLGCALLAVAGTGVSLGAVRLGGAPMHGLALVQLANLCFAAGQVWYRRLMARRGPLAERRAFAWCAAGAAAVAAGLALPRATGALGELGPTELLVLAYLGVVASGLCFYLWNLGARRVNTGVLAVTNDLKIPLGMAVSLLVFGERADWPRLALGGSLIVLAWWIAARQGREVAEAV
ncbi:MAG TPA: EamA family transporter [Anaeromyxobacteraceae bacterium]|nr:EamA family transporter [Anaeromyxobacteraceae bacterium]